MASLLDLFGGGSTPKAPDYYNLANSQSAQSRWNEQGPYGSVSWGAKPGADPLNLKPGDMTRTTSFSPEQQQLYDSQVNTQRQAGAAAGGIATQLQDGLQGVGDSIYQHTTRYYDQDFDRQQEQLRTKLLNSGVAPNSSAWGAAFQDFNKRRDAAYADAAGMAQTQMVGQQGQLTQQLAQLLGMSSPQVMQSQNTGQAANLLGAGEATYSAQMDQFNADQANREMLLNALVKGGQSYM